jgi:nitroreductase
MSSIKIAHSAFPIMDVIKKRWSPRAFSGNPISEDEMNILFESARWAPSANNEQPWQYIYAHQGTDGFNKISECFMPGNKPWAINAGTLVIAVARKTFEANGNENLWAHHDLGLANAQLLLQATSLGIYAHVVAGFDKSKLIESLGLNETQDPVCIITLGYLADAETLEEPFKTRELTERSRKNISEFAHKI